MSAFNDLSRARTSDDRVVMEMDLDEQLKALRYLTTAPPSRNMLPPTLLPDWALNKWVKKHWDTPTDVENTEQPDSVQEAGSNTLDVIDGPRILDQRNTTRIAAMFCVSMRGSGDGPRNAQGDIKLDNVKVARVHKKRQNFTLVRIKSYLMRKFSRKIKPIM